jgi:hypothetical protein
LSRLCKIHRAGVEKVAPAPHQRWSAGRTHFAE